MHLVAEGVETEGQREILKALGCRVMQGFLLGRPAPAAKSRLWPRRCHNLGCVQTPTSFFLMSGNTLGTLFTVTNFGESHGPAIGCVVDGCPGPGTGRGRHPARTGSPSSRHLAPCDPAPGKRIRSRSCRASMKALPPAPHRPAHPQHRRAQQDYSISPTPSARPRRLRLLAQVRRARSAAGVRRRLTRPRWRPAPSPRNGWPNATACACAAT